MNALVARTSNSRDRRVLGPAHRDLYVYLASVACSDTFLESSCERREEEEKHIDQLSLG